MKGDGSGIGGRGLLIASIGFIVIVGAIFFAISGGIFSGSTDSREINPVVTDVLEGRSVRMTVEGPIVANEDRESYKIEVGVGSRRIEALKGYEETIVTTHTYGNNYQAYNDFIYALSRAGFDEKRNIGDNAADERGVCPNGEQYIFEILDNGQTTLRLWSTSCSRSLGTLDAEAKAIKALFDKQIPDRKTVLEAISLN